MGLCASWGPCMPIWHTLIYIYTAEGAEMFGGSDFWLETRVIIKIFMKWSKKIFFEQKKSKWRTQNNWVFQNCQFSILWIVPCLGLVELLDAKGIWPWSCPTWAQQQAKNAFFVFLGHFCAYVGQPHNHVSHINALCIIQSMNHCFWTVLFK